MKTLPGEIGQMVLQQNKLECLPREFCDLPSDARVYLYHNPLASSPIEVCYAGMPFIKSYFQALESDTAVKITKRTKIVRAKVASPVSSEQYNYSWRDFCRTHVSRKKTERLASINIESILKMYVDLVMLDCGGQRSYPPISQLFTSNSCLVIITVDAKQYTVRGELALDVLFNHTFSESMIMSQ